MDVNLTLNVECFLLFSRLYRFIFIFIVVILTVFFFFLIYNCYCYMLEVTKSDYGYPSMVST